MSPIYATLVSVRLSEHRAAWVIPMKVFYATVAALLLTAAAAATPGDGQTFILKEWIWSDGTTTTTFTALGPADQVNQLEPQSRPLECDGCELASSVHFEPSDGLHPAVSR